MRKRKCTDEEIAEFRRQAGELSARARAILADEAGMADVQARLATTADTVRRQSPRNQVLLMLQAIERGIDLHDVDTYEGWRIRGRTVVAGATSLRRVVPRDDPDRGAGSRTERRARFRTQPVFDISQTKPLRDRNTTAGSAPAAALGEAGAQPEVPQTMASPEWTHALGQVSEIGYRIERSGSAVRVDVVGRTIFVPANLAEQAAAATLAKLFPMIVATEADVGQQPATVPSTPKQEPSDEAGKLGNPSIRALTVLGDWEMSQPSAQLGPQWPHVTALIDRAAHLSSAERRRLENFTAATDRDAVRAAVREAIAVAVAAERDEAYRLASHSPAGKAAVALMVRDLLPAEYYRTLVEPWDRLLGPLHPEDAPLSRAS